MHYLSKVKTELQLLMLFRKFYINLIMIYKYMSSISKNVYIDELDDIVNKYNNIYHSTIKVKPFDANWSTYINSSKEFNGEDPKFKIGDIVRKSKFENFFAKGYVLKWSEESFDIAKVKSIVPWIYVTSDLKGKEIVETFFKK